MKNSKRTIKKELMYLSSITCIIPIFIFLAFTVFNKYTAFKEEIKTINEGSIGSVNNILDREVNKSSEDLFLFTENEFMVNSSINNLESNKIIESLMNTYLASDSTILSVYVFLDDGLMITAPEVNLPEDYDPKVRDWHIGAVNGNGEIYASDPYVDVATGKLVSTYSKVIKDSNGNVKGVFAVDKCIDNYTDFVNELNIGLSGNVLLLTKKGEVVASSGAEKFVLNEEDSKKILEINENEELSLNINSEDYIVYKGNNEASKLISVVLIPQKVMASAFIKIGIAAALIVLLAVILIIYALKVIGNKVSEPIKKIVDSLNDIKNGDLSKECDINEEYSVEINSIIAALKVSIIGLREVFNGVMDMTDEVSNEAHSVFGLINDTTEVGYEISSSVTQIAEGATTQAADLEGAMSLMKDLEGEIRNTDRISRGMLTSSAKVQEASDNGTVTIETLNNTYDENKKLSEGIVSKINVLNDKSNEIGSIVETMQQIISQTNLLALNASIEAARAGEAGRGFSIVADEIRKLAEESAQSAEGIFNVISHVKNSVDELNVNAESMAVLNNKTDQCLKETKDEFMKIKDRISTLEEDIKACTKSFSVISHNNVIIGKNLEKISEVSEESAAMTEEVSAGTLEQSDKLQEISSAAGQLNTSAQELKSLMSRFKL